MNRKRLKRRYFSFMWDGLIHLNDGSQWRLADPVRKHDVTWWQNGETVDIERHRGGLILRNVERQENVPIVAAMELRLELAA
jgi:hypothetical protein